MPNIDIPVNADLAKLFELPPCSELSIPGPKPLKVKLPTGGSFSAFADISKGIPTDCSMTFSLMMQIAPFLAASECLLNILKLVSALIDLIKALAPVPDPTKLPDALKKFGKAADDIKDCLLVPTPANIKPFLRDLLCLILRVLKCFVSQMNSIVTTMEGLEIRLDVARNNGNLEEIAVLQCAQANASAQAQHLTASLEPVGILLDLAGAMFDIAGVPSIKLPAAGSDTDVQSLKAVLKAVQEVTVVIDEAVNLLGGCG
jgi:hypothetical protein